MSKENRFQFNRRSEFDLDERKDVGRIVVVPSVVLSVVVVVLLAVVVVVVVEVNFESN